MRLIYTAYRKAGIHLSMHCPEGFFVFIKEGASMLVNHNSIVFKSLVAAAVEFFGKQSLCMAKGICRVIYNEVVFSSSASKEAKSVLMGYMNPLIIKPLYCIGEKLPTNLNHLFVRLYNFYSLDFGICSQLSGYTSVTSAYYKHTLYIWVY